MILISGCLCGVNCKYNGENNLNENVELDFDGIDRVSTTFLTCLFTNMINKKGRENIISKINVKNLSNYTDYSRVVAGTTFA